MRVRILFALVVPFVLAGMAMLKADDAPPPPPEGVTVLARGPVHEAYAEPSLAQPEPSPVVPKRPPGPINEVPPDQKPDGDVVWIPGYWAWDTDQTDFVWVSGFWRTPPPDRQWVAGTWQEVEGGWQWTPGLWLPAGQDQVDYLPTPPASLDEGPSTPAPDDTSTYVPGCWVYRTSRFFWRPGFWGSYHPGWVWSPARYVWTPAGCVFNAGYWDRPLDDRGLLFAPVTFDRAIVREPRFRYVPQYVVQPDFLLSALFARPATSHYWFGDYFEPQYRKAGFVPWIDYRVGKSVDANFAYYRNAHAEHAGWAQGMRELYAGRFAGTVARPPHDLVQQNKVIERLNTERKSNVAINKNINITHLQNVHALAPLSRANALHVTGLGSLAGAHAEGRPPAERPIHVTDVSRDHHALAQDAAQRLQEVARQRQTEQARVLRDGRVPVQHTDTPHTVKLAAPPRAPSRPSPAPAPAPAHRPAAVPAVPRMPAHEERPLPARQPAPPRPGPRPAAAPAPAHEAPRPAAPVAPASRPPAHAPAPPPPHHEAPPAPHPEAPHPAPPRPPHK